ncbi:MAG TPA: outer membrane beta-barrel domain-containing protein [Polyangia bacterium]|nr:outer membrane beta-barrel domain-containing protein [Polyangia bacterium]
MKTRIALAIVMLLIGSRAARAAEHNEPERSPAPPDEASAGGSGPSQGPDDNEASDVAGPSEGHGDACIDENIKADLFAKRRIRTTRDRLFQQSNRHELTVLGGYYISDLFDGTVMAGGAYTYHMTEDLAVEASGSWTRITSSGGPELERTFQVLQGKPRRQLGFDTDLVWVPAHAKMRLGGAITHLDLYLALGGGVVDSVLSSDLAGNGGIGMKFFLGHAWAIRFDVRDHVFREQLLAEKVYVNDVTTTLGVSLYLPLEE